MSNPVFALGTVRDIRAQFDAVSGRRARSFMSRTSQNGRGADRFQRVAPIDVGLSSSRSAGCCAEVNFSGGSRRVKMQVSLPRTICAYPPLRRRPSLPKFGQRRLADAKQADSADAVQARHPIRRVVVVLPSPAGGGVDRP